MEFKIANKAKMLTVALMGGGLLFLVIGLIMHMGDDNFLTRLLSNTLINSFFFFSIGLGALFFLALQYATETGWYATVKRVIEGLAGFLPVGIVLMLVALLSLTFTHGAHGHVYVWMDPEVYNPDSHHYDPSSV